MFWHNLTGPSRSRVRLTLLAACFATLLSFGAGAAPASAGTDNFCIGWVAADKPCLGPNHSLTSSKGANYTSGAGCGGAYLYGSYFCATQAGCHNYSGNTVLSPAVRHRSSTQKQMYGSSTWGSTPAPSYCDPGTPYAVSGPLGSDAAQPDVPVLDRPKEEAPAEVAALWSNADPDAARHVDTPAGDAWVLPVPVDHKICIAVEDDGTGYGYGCTSFAEATDRGALVTLEDADSASAKGDVAIAIVPNEADSLEITRRDGSVKKVAADEGIVAVELGARDLSIELDAGENARPQKWSVGRRR